MSALPVCGARDLAVTVRWERERDGVGLQGNVIAENVGARACRLPGKPWVQPLGLDGEPLPAVALSTADGRTPDYVVVEPGARAAAPVGWSQWCGAPAAGRARVTWDGGTAMAAVEGPAQPGCEPGESGDHPGNLYTSWFELTG